VHIVDVHVFIGEQLPPWPPASNPSQVVRDELKYIII
jgi:hypothetical protein